jgi:hypothetical protein
MSQLQTATNSASLADILERVLDKGLVIAGDIRIKLVDIELLTIQIRLVVCSIDRAKEIGMDWWNTRLENPAAVTAAAAATAPSAAIANDASEMAIRLAALEDRLAGMKSKMEAR